jgi:hypothetical protein
MSWDFAGAPASLRLRHDGRLVRLLFALITAVASSVLVVAPAAAGTKPAPSSDDICARFASAGPSGTVEDVSVIEASGLAASRSFPGVWWTHNDSGGTADVHAMTAAGKNLGTYTVEGATATDWEDIAAGPGPDDGDFLYIGDIGDNGSNRPTVTVYRVAEPATRPNGTGAPLSGATALELQYPNGPSDAEALFVDPVSGDLYILTKAWDGPVSHVLRARAKQLQPGAPILMEEVATFPTDTPLERTEPLGTGLPSTLVTAADISPDGRVVLVRTYRRIVAFERRKKGGLAAAFAAGSCDAPQVEEGQGEAVAFAANGKSYLTVSEGAAPTINRFTVKPPLAPIA